MGIKDLNKKYELHEIIRGDSIFCATGITSSNVIEGIKIENDNYTSETFVTHKSSKLKKLIKKTSLINE
jgi:fructose-1,6-bisphosphatase II / sedoheptulose-1,7-bisphosphatase